jgi:asparagine synthase (glutamine-hydrolysing)
MYPYVAFLYDSRNLHADRTVRGWADAFRRDHEEWTSLDAGNGLTLLHESPRGRSASAAVLSHGRGAILGTVFPNHLIAAPRETSSFLDERSVDEIVRTHGRHLTSHFWGGYLAFLNYGNGASHCVLRDCSGKVPCYMIDCGDVTIATSDIEDLTGLGLPSFSINQRYLAGFFHEAELAQRECALNEVKELLAGECLEVEGNRARQFAMWDPRPICRDDSIEDFADACRQVRMVTQTCIDHWASRYDRIVHHLSGGLDSSVVLGCLRRSAHQPIVTCLHIESGGAGESERAFAQLVADAAGMKLSCQPAFSEHVKYDERVFRLPKAPKPSVGHLGMAIDPDLRNRVPSEVDADATWDGQGGDHLFFESRAFFAAVDYAFRHGVSGDFPRQVRDAVRLSRQSCWGVLAKAARLGLCRFRWHPEQGRFRDPMFLNRGLISTDMPDYIWQPWSANSSDLPPGKRLQIGLLARLIHRHRPVPGLQYAEAHHPLFSQPLFELCLKIPIYVMLRGGVNRSLEREAFRHCVPDAVIRRENKGTIETGFMSKIRESMPFIRGLLLDGVLVRERIIERSALEPYLVRNRPLSLAVLWPFLSCLAAEIWARKWADDAWRI